MNRKQLITLIVVLAVLGGAGWLASKKKNQTNQSAGTSTLTIGENLLPDFPINDVSQISIIQSTQQMTLVKQQDLWTVKERGQYPANFGNISDLLRKVWEIKITKPVNVTEARLPALELVSPDKGGQSGTKVDLKDKDGNAISSLLLGAEHMREAPANPQFGGGGAFPDGRYVMVDGDLKRIALVSDPLSSVAAQPANWINKDFIKVEKIKSVTVQSQDEASDWSLSRESESGNWKLANTKEGEELDSTKVTSANYLLSSPYFNDVIINPDPAQTGLNEARSVVIETFGNFKYEMKIGKVQTGDNYPVTVSVSGSFPETRTPGADEKEEDKERLDKEFNDALKVNQEKLAKEKALEQWTYEVSKWTVDFLLKNRADLLAEKTEEGVALPPGSDPGIGVASPIVPAPAVSSPPVPVTLPEPAEPVKEPEPATEPPSAEESSPVPDPGTETPVEKPAREEVPSTEPSEGEPAPPVEESKETEPAEKVPNP